MPWHPPCALISLITKTNVQVELRSLSIPPLFCLSYPDSALLPDPGSQDSHMVYWKPHMPFILISRFFAFFSMRFSRYDGETHFPLLSHRFFCFLKSPSCFGFFLRFHAQAPLLQRAFKTIHERDKTHKPLRRFSSYGVVFSVLHSQDRCDTLLCRLFCFSVPLTLASLLHRST